jgi:Protein of unknown function (DUF3616)
MTVRSAIGIALLVTSIAGVRAASAQADVVSHSGMCDASAGIALDADHFVVANDERNRLMIYKRGERQPIGKGVDLAPFLGTNPKKESDLEGAATIGNRIYWISSHGRNSSGEFQARRHRFFATDIKPGQPPSVAVVGTKPYTNLLKDMLEVDALKAMLSAAEPLAPEAPGGLNIEGLAATPDGKLLIGFRNPLPQDHALVVPLENPSEVVDGKKARFGAPIPVRGLEKRGIRSIERVGSDYLLIAGPTADAGTFALFRWSGKAGDDATPVGADLKGLRPEALFVTSEGLQLLSDDGGVKVGADDCKDLDDESKQSFRAIVVKP